MKTALVQDWLMTVGGAERCLEILLELFPSPLFTLVYNPKALKKTFLENQPIKASFIQKLPFATKHYQRYLPLFPLAIEQFDLTDYDLIISSSHSVAKGVLTHSEQWHICYCHTPMRYAWDLYHSYLTQFRLKRGFKAAVAKFFLHYLRGWDYQSASRVDAYIANSRYIAKRIEKTYRRKAAVIYPPVATHFFTLGQKKDSFYITASRLVPYKKIDLIVTAFATMKDKKLVVIGDGPELKKIRSKATKNIELLGYQENSVLKDYLQRAKAFIFAAIEDFGILPVEAQACGTPVIAYGKGGCLETVIEGKTGLFFRDQTVLSLRAAVEKFEQLQDQFSPAHIRAHAETFGETRFKREFYAFVTQSYQCRDSR
ncbi:MAG: glycosyltransferase family 4 protein [Chlamydiota bacterium]